ncbi:zinc finger and SCAN domain-containing protein 12 [Eupeodes corollae]|uniref:zinc finger and SCAN domain-containing protein 12 n=1 Tax=Eupeodes corollae TaxID=290404 RepID=UPI0024916C55|nr:zinc finger and SCAN domain-containing protein 12 [Eupeodes corollae]
MTSLKSPNKLSEPNLETICRLCLHQPENGSINIFQRQLLSIPVRIMACADLEVQNGDGLPSLICEKCRYQLEVSYYFRKKCQISDGKLRKHIRMLNAGKKSRVFVKSSDEDDDEDEEELHCKQSIGFIEAIDARKKAEEDEKNQKWLEEQREQMRREETQRLSEELRVFMQSRVSVPKSMKQENNPFSTPSSQTQTAPTKCSRQKRDKPQEVSRRAQSKAASLGQIQRREQQQHLQQQHEEQLQQEAEADNEITSSEQIPDEQANEHEQEHDQDQSMFYSDDNGGEENSEMLRYEAKNNGEGEDHRNHQIIHIGSVDDEAEMLENMCEEEEGMAEDISDENEMEGKANTEAEEMDEFIFLADSDDSNPDVGQTEQDCVVESYQIEENGDIQYLKDERRDDHDEDDIHSIQLDNSSDSKYVVEDVGIVNVQKHQKKVKPEKNKKPRKMQLPVIDKAVTLLSDNVLSDDLRIFKCSECPQSFTGAKSLLRHRSAHKGGREYCCDYCEKFFSCKSSLDRHIRIHTGVKPYTCDQCGKNFMQKEILKRHETIHTGNRPYQCPHCPRSFVQRSLMKQHINAVHLAVPQITKNECHLCPKSFLHPSGLSRHLLTHKGMLFSCPGCGRTFNDKSSLRRHFSAVHVKKGQSFVTKAEPNDENDSSNDFLTS